MSENETIGDKVSSSPMFMFSNKLSRRRIKRKERQEIFFLIRRSNGPIQSRSIHKQRSSIDLFFYFHCVVFLDWRRKAMTREKESTDMEPERILVHKLVDASKAQRNKAVEKFKSWINLRTTNPVKFFTYDDLIKIWKGLYYNMWMADKPLLQVSNDWIDRSRCIFSFCHRSNSQHRSHRGFMNFEMMIKHDCTSMLDSRPLLGNGGESIDGVWVNSWRYIIRWSLLLLGLPHLSPIFLVRSIFSTGIFCFPQTSSMDEGRYSKIHENDQQKCLKSQWKSFMRWWESSFFTVWSSFVSSRTEITHYWCVSGRIGQSWWHSIETETITSIIRSIF